MRIGFLFFIFLLTLLSIGSFKLGNAFFTSSAVSSNNTFSTAEVFPSGTPSATLSPTPTTTISPTPIEGLANHIVISEVQTATSGASTSDFIELYNPTASTINLNGYRLVMRTSPGTADTNVVVFSSEDSIPSHSFLLWCNSSLALAIECDESSSDTISNNNSIALRNGPVNTGIIIDALAWGSGQTAPLVETIPFITNIPDNQSIERKAYSTSDVSTMVGVDASKGNGYDTDNNSNDFVLRTVSQPQNSSSSTEIP